MTQGMLDAPAQQSQGAYNGTVDVMGTPVEVKNGVANFQGQTFYVSNNGMLVVNDKRQIFGFIEDGVFKKNTPEHIQMLKDQGFIE